MLAGNFVTALRLSEKFWLNLQIKYNLEVENDKLKGRLKKEVKMLIKVT